MLATCSSSSIFSPMGGRDGIEWVLIPSPTLHATLDASPIFCPTTAQRNRIILWPFPYGFLFLFVFVLCFCGHPRPSNPPPGGGGTLQSPSFSPPNLVAIGQFQTIGLRDSELLQPEGRSNYQSKPTNRPELIIMFNSLNSQNDTTITVRLKRVISYVFFRKVPPVFCFLAFCVCVYVFFRAFPPFLVKPSVNKTTTKTDRPVTEDLATSDHDLPVDSQASIDPKISDVLLISGVRSLSILSPTEK